MAFSKMWTPPAIPLSITGSAPNQSAWDIFRDIHDHFILAGCEVVSSGAQEIDLTPAVASGNYDWSMGTYFGHKVYKLIDSMSDNYPIYIKLTFGLGHDGPPSNYTGGKTRTPNIKVMIGSSVDGDGNFTSPDRTTESFHPQHIANSRPTIVGTQNNSAGTSYISSGEGYFAFMYGVGSRNKPQHTPSGNYRGATLSIIIQRTVDESGKPTSLGYCTILPDLNATVAATGGNPPSDPWNNGIITPFNLTICKFQEAYNVSSKLLALAVGGTTNASVDGQVQLNPVYMQLPKLIQFPSVVSYVFSEIGVSTIIDVTTSAGTTQKFMTIGNETNLSVDPVSGHRLGLAILWHS